MSILNEQLENLTGDELFFTAQMVRDNFNFKDEEIVNLCKRGFIKPRKNNEGKIYFTQDDVKVMQKISRMYKNANEKESEIENKLVSQQSLSQKQSVNLAITKAFERLNMSLKNIEEGVPKRVESILNEKLDGLDDVIVELIKYKTENEKLKDKIEELTIKNVEMKTNLNRFKKFGFGFWVKSSR